MSLPRDTQRSAWLKVASSQGPAEPAAAPSLTYEPYYGLKEKPFSLSADPRFLFKSRAHASAFDQLLAGIRRREGLIVLTGEIGTGKTTLCRAVLGSLDRRTFSTFVPDPFVSREDLLKMLLVDFGVMSIEDLKNGRLNGASRPELSYPLYDFLNSLVPLQAYAVLVLDEAQNLPLALLEEIRILSDLEGREKLLQVVLIGQPELRANLKLPEMRQVNQRVSVRCELAPLVRTDIGDYVTTRLNVAAGGTSTVQFTPDALDVVHRASGGTPRLINLICDRSLHEGHARRVNRIDAPIVSDALAVLGVPEAKTELASEPRPDAAITPPPPYGKAEADAAEADALSDFASEAALPATDTLGRTPAFVVALLVASALAVATGSWSLVSVAFAARNLGVPNLPLPRAVPILQGAAALPLPPATSGTITAVTPATVGQYIIQVASFESSARAARLVDELTTAGYRSYQAEYDSDSRGRMWHVIVGGYDNVTDAQADLDRIRAMPSYRDATVRVILGKR